MGAAIDSRHMEVFQLEPSQMRGYQIRRLHMAVEEVRYTASSNTQERGLLVSLKLGVNQLPYFCMRHWVSITGPCFTRAIP